MSLILQEHRDTIEKGLLDNLTSEILEKADEAALGSEDLKLTDQYGHKVLQVGPSITAGYPQLEELAIKLRNRRYPNQKMQRDSHGHMRVFRPETNPFSDGANNHASKLHQIKIISDSENNGLLGVDITFSTSSLNNQDFGQNYGNMTFSPEDTASKYKILMAIKIVIEELRIETLELTDPFNRSINQLLANLQI